jgi:large subunit ribosomal protein L35
VLIQSFKCNDKTKEKCSAENKMWYNSSTMAKVKMKSNRSAKKRFKITGSGKIKRWKSGGAHYNTKKSKKRKRALRKPDLVHPSWEDKVRGMLKEF